MIHAKNLSAALLLGLASSVALADTAAIHLGLGHWHADADGSLYGNDLDDLNYKTSDNRHFFVAIEHPVPLLPNVRLQYNELEHKGKTQLGNVAITSKTTLNYADAIGYYELLDNWISFDLGAGVRHYDGESVVIPNGNPAIVDKNVDTYLPIIYADANFDLPLTGLSLGGNFQGGSFDSTEFTEYSARISYMIDAVVDFGAELGYKQQNLKRINGLDYDTDYAGPYLTLKATF